MTRAGQQAVALVAMVHYTYLRHLAYAPTVLPPNTVPLR